MELAIRLQSPQCLRHGIVGDRIHQSNFESSRGGDFFRRDKKLQRSSLPDQSRQALRPSPSRHEAEGGATMAKNSVGRGDPAVTGEREIETSAHAVAFDRGHDRRGIAGDGVHQRLSHGREFISLRAGQRGDFVQICADRKKLAIAGYDQWSDVCFQFASQFTDCDGQRAHAAACKAIGSVGRSKSHDAYGAVGLDLEEECRHGTILSDARGGDNT